MHEDQRQVVSRCVTNHNWRQELNLLRGVGFGENNLIYQFLSIFRLVPPVTSQLIIYWLRVSLMLLMLF